MERTLSLFMLLLLVSGVTVSCDELQPLDKVQPAEEKPLEKTPVVSFSFESLTVLEDDVLSRTSVSENDGFIWAAGDTVGIYPDEGSQIYFVAQVGEVPSSNADFNGGGWSFKTNSTYSCYYPFIGDIYLDRSNIPVTFVGQRQDSTSSISHIGPYHYFYTEPTKASGGYLNFTLKALCCVIRPKLTLPAGTYTKLAITAPSDVFVRNGHYSLAGGSCSITGDEMSNQLQIDLGNITLSEQTTFRVYLTSAPVNLKGVEITVSVLNSQKTEFQCRKTPSAEYTANTLAGLTCSSWTEVPQTMGMIISDWGNAGTISGDAQ